MAGNLFIAIIATAGLLVISYFLVFFRRIFSLPYDNEGIIHRLQVPEWATKSFSVIICARDESANLQAFLPKVLGQNYCFEDGKPAFEVIVVNDCSEDNTDVALSTLSRSWENLRVITIEAREPGTLPGKKFPLSKALAAGRYEWIACIDADCAPATDVWLHCLAAPLLQGREIVLGYGGFVLQKGLVNAFTRYETMQTFFLYYAFTKAGFPYMGVGRNLAATKAAFLKAQAHPLWQRTPSGDDDLLVQISGNKHNVGVITHAASFTWTKSKSTWGGYFAQKSRHVSTGKLYSWQTQTILAGYAFSTAALVLTTLLTPFFCPPHWAVVPIFMLAMRGITFTEGSPVLKQRTSVLKWVGFFFCWTLYNAVLAPFILWKTKQRWK